MPPTIRQSAFAGSFYLSDPGQLKAQVDQYLHDVQPAQPSPKAIIVPHAGYIYSGAVAASAYARLNTAPGGISRVVLIGPSHRVAFSGLAVSSADYFATPLGNIAIDKESRRRVMQLPFVQYLEKAHSQEHSLEVQLPFLQRQLDNFLLLPLVAGDASAEQVSQVLDCVWGGQETLIVISSDLSHYHNYATAVQLDKQTSHSIQALAYEKLDFACACGKVPISGLLAYARQHGLQVKNVDLRNSGDTAGDKSRVVGYGAFIID